MIYSVFKANRLAELVNEPWGDIRIPDLTEVYAVARPRSVLEVGCYRGVSTEFWALHCARVVAVDPWPIESIRREFLSRVGHYPHVEIIQAYSPCPVPAEEYDLVYLDGDHSYKTVKAEIEAYLRLVRPGGFIGGHDYTATPTPGDGVLAAVDERFGRPDYVFSDNSWLKKV